MAITNGKNLYIISCVNKDSYTYLYQMQEQPNNPLHGIRLDTIVEYLVDCYGWEHLGSRIPIRCFNENPSIKSSLTFLRKTPWAREKVESLYLRTLSNKKK